MPEMSVTDININIHVKSTNGLTPPVQNNIYNMNSDIDATVFNLTIWFLFLVIYNANMNNNAPSKQSKSTKYEKNMLFLYINSIK
jgi:hypothetical protein